MNTVQNDTQSITLAVTGASGIPYVWRLLEQLVLSGVRIHFLISKAAQMVIASETDFKLPMQPQALQDYLTDTFAAAVNQITVHGKQDWMAPIASGSGVADAMIVCPCSSGSLAAFAAGMSDNLIRRAVDVTLKERRKLILVHRETPLSEIHLQNMLQLTRMGAVILPANPGFYHQPRTVADLVDFVVARILEHVNIKQTIVKKWGL